jgi:hypothetical protein
MRRLRAHTQMKVLNFLKGKKAYLVAFLMIALGLVNGDDKLVLEGLAVASLRAGISKQ